jgi:hypothetical protein
MNPENEFRPFRHPSGRSCPGDELDSSRRRHRNASRMRKPKMRMKNPDCDLCGVMDDFTILNPLICSPVYIIIQFTCQLQKYVQTIPVPKIWYRLYQVPTCQYAFAKDFTSYFWKRNNVCIIKAMEEYII